MYPNNPWLSSVELMYRLLMVLLFPSKVPHHLHRSPPLIGLQLPMFLPHTVLMSMLAVSLAQAFSCSLALSPSLGVYVPFTQSRNHASSLALEIWNGLLLEPSP